MSGVDAFHQDKLVALDLQDDGGFDGVAIFADGDGTSDGGKVLGLGEGVADGRAVGRFGLLDGGKHDVGGVVTRDGHGVRNLPVVAILEAFHEVHDAGIGVGGVVVIGEVAAFDGLAAIL